MHNRTGVESPVMGVVATLISTLLMDGSRKSQFRQRIATLPPDRDDELCVALDAALGCPALSPSSWCPSTRRCSPRRRGACHGPGLAGVDRDGVRREEMAVVGEEMGGGWEADGVPDEPVDRRLGRVVGTRFARVQTRWWRRTVVLLQAAPGAWSPRTHFTTRRPNSPSENRAAARITTPSRSGPYAERCDA